MTHRFNLRRCAAIVMVFAAALTVSTAAQSQTYKAAFSTKLVLPKNGTDPTSTFTILAGALGGNLSWTLPTSNGSSGNVLSTDGSGNLSWAPALTNALTSAHILVGNGSNMATSVLLSGDATLDNAGAITVSKFNNGTTFGSMAGQAAGSVAITGGTIDGTVIGGGTAAAGTFTTIAGGSTITLGNHSSAAGSVVILDGTSDGGSNFTGTIAGPATFGANRTYTLPDVSGTIALTANIGSTAVGGDLSGTVANATVAKINGVALGTTTATDGNILIANGTNWSTHAVSGDATIANTGAVSVNAVHTAAASSIVTAVNTASANTLNADVLKYDASLKVASNQLGVDGSHANTWSGTQTLGGVALTASTPTQLSADQNDWALSASNSNFLISASTAVNVTGIAGGVSGRVIVLVNSGSGVITLKNENTGSTAANRIHLAGASDVLIAGDGTVTLLYDGTASRWRMISAE